MVDVVKTLTIKATTEGVDQATASLVKLSDAQTQVAVTSEQSSKATLSVDKALQNLQRRYDQEFRAQQDLAKAQKTLDQARAQGLITQSQQNNLMQQAIVFHNRNKDAVTLHSAALKELQSQAELAATHFGALGNILVSLGPAGLALGAIFGTVALGLHAAAEAGLALAERAGKLKDLSETIGITVTQLQALEIAAGRSGVGQEQLSTALEKLSVAFADIRTRSGSAFEALQRINPAFANQVSNAKSLSEAIDLLAKGFDQVDESSRNLAARGIFGRGGVGITRVLDEINQAGGLQNFIAQLNQTDLLTNKQADEFKKLGDEINEAFRLAKQNLEATFGPLALVALKNFSDKMLELSRTMKELDPSVAFKAFMDWLIDPRIVSIVGTISDFLSKGSLIPSTTILGTPVPGAPIAPSSTPPVGTPGQGMFPGFDAEEAATRAKGINMLKQAMTALSDETDKSTKANDDWRTKAIQAANDSARLTGALGGTATATETLQNQILQLNKQAAEGKITFQQAAEAIGRLQQQFNLSNLQANVQALGAAATSTEKYQLAVAQLDQKLRDGAISQDTFNRAVIALNPTLQTIDKTIGDLGSAMAGAFIQGQNAADAFNSALKAIGSTAASSAIKDLVKGISGQGFDLTSIATQGLIAGGALLLTKIFGGDTAAQQANQQKAKQLEDAAKSASSALDGVVNSFNQLVAVASGPVTTAIKNAQQQFAQLVAASQASQSAAFASFFAVGATPTQQSLAFVQFQQAQAAVGAAGAQLQEFTLGIIHTGLLALRGADQLSEVEQALADLNTQAADVAAAYALLGASAEDAAKVINEELAKGLAKLSQQVESDLVKQINELTGHDWINQVNDLLKTISDAGKVNVNPNTLASFIAAKGQDIVNQAQLTGDAFAELLGMFPQLTGYVHEFDAAAEELANTVARTADELKSAQQSLYQRLLQTAVDQNTLEGQLAILDYQQGLERQAEIKAGGENLAFLEYVQYQERLKVITNFNNQILDEQQQAEQDRLDTITKANQQIIDYLNGLLTGADSPLSPRARLEAAQVQFGQQLALAQGGDITALQGITDVAESLRTAAQAFYGSSASYIQIFNQIQATLSELAGGGGGQVFQSGGFVTGGISGRDSVRVLAMPGEYIVRRSVAQSHASDLSHLNRTGRWGANDNIESLLAVIAAKLDQNTLATMEQTQELNRESRLRSRKTA